jgi:hypothetical protein
MAEAGILPGTGVVTLRALTAVVVVGTVVAGLAVSQPGVTEAGILPGAGAVALRTLAAEVVGWPIVGVAGLAIGFT